MADNSFWQTADVYRLYALFFRVVAKIFSSCAEEGNFIPDDVGFAEKRFDRITLEDDHVMCSAAEWEAANRSNPSDDT